MFTKTQSRLLGRVEGRMEPVRGQDDRKRERHAMDGVWLPPVEDDPEHGAFPAVGIRSGPGLSRGRPFPP